MCKILLGVAFLALVPSTWAADYVVHEWGTFTTVLGPDNHEVRWSSLPLDDLPSFVHRDPFRFKEFIKGTVRMETPVIYFHTSEALTVSVDVAFPKGELTEWYPFAVRNDQGLSWRHVSIDPKASVILPMEIAGGHYEAARGVNAAFVEVPVDDKTSEVEKFLFYRGVGTFEIPIEVQMRGSEIAVKNRTPALIDRVMLFERTASGVAHAIARDLSMAEGERVFLRSELEFVKIGRLDDLAAILRDQGLREDEAQAMIATWRHDWFETGVRVFYTVPREVIDTVLPLSIEPEPQDLVRVMIGRVELLTADRVESLVSYLADRGRPSQDLVDGVIQRCGRFGLAAVASGCIPGAAGEWDRALDDWARNKAFGELDR